MEKSTIILRSTRQTEIAETESRHRITTYQSPDTKAETLAGTSVRVGKLEL